MNNTQEPIRNIECHNCIQGIKILRLENTKELNRSIKTVQEVRCIVICKMCQVCNGTGKLEVGEIKY